MIPYKSFILIHPYYELIISMSSPKISYNLIQINLALFNSILYQY